MSLETEISKPSNSQTLSETLNIQESLNVLSDSDSDSESELEPELESKEKEISPELQLINAVKNEDFSSVHSILEKKEVNVNFVDADDTSALRYAIAKKRPNIVKVLLENGADPNLKDKKGETSLHDVNSDDLETIKLLLTFNADPNNADNEGVTPFQTLLFDDDFGFDNEFNGKISRNGKEAIKLFLQKGADVKTKAATILPPLLGALITFDFDLVKLFIEKGADINATVSIRDKEPKENYGETSLLYALLMSVMKTDKVEVLPIFRFFLEKGAKLKCEGQDPYAVLKLLANVYYEMPKSNTKNDKKLFNIKKNELLDLFLYEAILNGDSAMLNAIIAPPSPALVSAKANDDSHSDSDNDIMQTVMHVTKPLLTAITAASQGLNTAIITELGFDAHLYNRSLPEEKCEEFAENIKHFGHIGILDNNQVYKFLNILQYHAKLQDEKNQNKSPTETVDETITNFNSTTSDQNSEIQSPSNNNETEKKDEDEDPLSLESQLIAAVKDGKLADVESILKQNVKIDFIDKSGCSPLQYAISNESDKNLDIAKLLLQHNANPDLKDEYGETQLFYAIHNKNLEAVKQLLEFKADPNIPNNKGETPLIKSFEDCVVPHDEAIVRLLISHGADIKSKINGIPALFAALSTLNLNIIKLFVDKGVDVNTVGNIEDKNKKGEMSFLSLVLHTHLNEKRISTLPLFRFLLEKGATLQSELRDPCRDLEQLVWQQNISPTNLKMSEYDIHKLLKIQKSDVISLFMYDALLNGNSPVLKAIIGKLVTAPASIDEDRFHLGNDKISNVIEIVLNAAKPLIDVITKASQVQSNSIKMTELGFDAYLRERSLPQEKLETFYRNIRHFGDIGVLSEDQVEKFNDLITFHANKILNPIESKKDFIKDSFSHAYFTTLFGEEPKGKPEPTRAPITTPKASRS